MPWTPKDATRFTHKATTSHSKAVFAKVANAGLAAGKSEGSSIRIANAVVARMHKKPKTK